MNAPGRSALVLLALLTELPLAAQTAPGPPSISAHPGDKALTVAWTEPGNSPGITAYDVRWILTSADETVDANWTLIDNAWTSGGLHEIVTGLTNDTEYDVQVRAVASSVDGAWSATIGRVTPSDTQFDVTPTLGGSGYETPATWTRADLGTLPAPGVPIAGVLDDANDKDGYLIALRRGTMLRIQSSGILGSNGILYLTNAEGTALLRYNQEASPPSPDPSQELSIDEPLTAGHYILQVTPPSNLSSATQYELSWAVEPQEKDTALPFALDGSVEGVIGTRDKSNWFKIDLAEETDLLIWSYAGLFRYFEHNQAVENLKATLYDSDGKKIRSSLPAAMPPAPSSGPPNLTGHFVIRVRNELPSGTYYLQVEHLPLNVTGPIGESLFVSSVFSGAYTLFAAKAATENGDAIASAVPIEHEKAIVGGRIDDGRDVDYFRVSLASGGYLVAGVASGDVTLDMSVVDGDDNAVAMAEYPLNFASNVRAIWSANRVAAGDYYLRVGNRSGTGGYWLRTGGDLFNDLFHQFCTVRPGDVGVVDDAIYSCQWHLPLIKAKEAWTTGGVTGAGITVAVVDDGLEENHVDLVQNVDTKAGRDYTSSGLRTAWSHGTRVAGLVGARANDIGIRGVAPKATIYGRNWLAPQSPLDVASLLDATLNRASTTAISNNSWGVAGEAPSVAPAAWKRAIRQGLRTGWGGKGTVYVFAAGNGAEKGGDVNLSEYANHYGVMAVCGSGPPHPDDNTQTRVPYSQTGATLWVCAPTEDPRPAYYDYSGILTTGDFSLYFGGFNGTSASAPMVAGVAALVREKNPALTWRDVKLVLAGSAAKNDPNSAGWLTAGPKWEDSSSSYNYNREYGFGVVDAKAAVDLAQTWQLLPSFVETKAVRSTPNQPIEDASKTGKGKLVRAEITIDDEIEFIEFVQIDVDMDAPDFRDLELELVSPGGKVSKLSSSWDFTFDPLGLLGAPPSNVLPSPFSLGSARFLGERPEGVWTLRVQDVLPPEHLEPQPEDMVLKSWSLKFYGHRKTPGAPTVYVSPNYGQLIVSWSKPRVIGASDVTGYKLRWATETDAEAGTWTTVDDAGSGGPNRELLDDLTDGTRYAVQVQGINAQGSGRWSTLQIGVPGPPPPPGGGTGGGDGGDDDDDGDDGDDPPPPATAPTAAIGVDAACADGLCRARTGAPVRFEDKSTGTVRYRLWNFDGVSRSRSRQATVAHTFESPGFYDVTLTVSLDGERESVASLKFLVEAAHPAGTCQATDTTLCLRDSRYEVSLGWWTADGQSGDATVVRKGTNDSGLFWFFADDNWEMLVKVLDGCSLNGRHWVFAASATNLGYALRVRDTVTGEVKEYRNEPGMPSPAVADSAAFACSTETPAPEGR